MGAWGIGVFENDGAGDLLAEFKHADTADRETVLRETLEFAAGTDDYLENPEAQAAVAAAALVAAGRHGRPVEDLDAPVPSLELIDLAKLALDRVVSSDSEWRELWEESGALEEALAVAEVRTALNRP